MSASDHIRHYKTLFNQENNSNGLGIWQYLLLYDSLWHYMAAYEHIRHHKASFKQENNSNWSRI